MIDDTPVDMEVELLRRMRPLESYKSQILTILLRGYSGDKAMVDEELLVEEWVRAEDSDQEEAIKDLEGTTVGERNS